MSPGVQPLPAVVSPCGGANGLAAIRSLGRLGVEVVAADASPHAIAMRSRYARPVISPRPLEDDEAFVAFLVELHDDLGRPAVILPANDAVLNVVARNRDALGDRYLYPFPRWSVLERIQDKWFQLRTAASAGIAAPRTASEPTDQLGFPVLVKPADPAPFQDRFDGLHAFTCANMRELEVAFRRSADFRPLVQEFIPGGDDTLYTLGAYVSAAGEPLGLFSGRKLRQSPPNVGTCRVGEAVWVDEVVEQGLRFVDALGFHGICQVEFKFDRRDGRFKLMEINPRLWQWHGLAAACGVDVVRLAYWDLTGDRPSAVRMNHEGRRWAITLMGRTKPALQRPPYVDALFALDDLRPSAVDIARHARAGVRWLARGFS